MKNTVSSKMTDAQTILKMIEEVDPADTAKLDEIDRCVQDYVGSGYNCFRITRSRNELKSIRPDGWTWVANTQDDGCHFNYYSPNPNHMRRFSSVMPSEYLPTEELSELHAIIQAIEHERTHK